MKGIKNMRWYFKTNIRKSSIHGHGRFTEEFIRKGELIVNIYGNINKNENNSYVNHSKDNNIDWNGYNGWISNRDIQLGEEITMNYRQWIDTEVPDDHWLNRS